MSIPPGQDREAVAIAVLQYMFESVEPVGLNYWQQAIFEACRANIDISIENEKNGKKGGRPRKTPFFEDENPPFENSKTPLFEDEKPGLKKSKTTRLDKTRLDETRPDQTGQDETGQDETVEKASKPAKHKHGEYQHVLLTEDEYQRLSDELGEEMLAQCIRKLDEYIEEKGYKAKSHYLSIKRWVVDAVREHRKKDGGIDWDSV
jgi:hypothetical protein